MAGHTRGPWSVILPSAEHPSRAMVAAGSGVTIYDAPLTTETEANARLIAAAPDLLRELERLTDRFKHAVASNVRLPNFDPEEHVAIKSSREAIAKARV